MVPRYIPKKLEAKDLKEPEIIDLDPQQKVIQNKGKGILVDHTPLSKEILLQGDSNLQHGNHPELKSASDNPVHMDAIKGPDLVLDGELRAMEILRPTNELEHNYEAGNMDSDEASVDTVFDEASDPVHSKEVPNEIVQDTLENIIQQYNVGHTDLRNSMQIARNIGAFHITNNS